MSESPAEPDPETGEDEQPEEFLNRAARRAQGKRTGRPQQSAQGMRPAGRGAVQSPRQYGNRRSG